ncbi:MAG: hypothetical protein FIB08_16960 [Candidatus Methanoperedens sp.]|nr:hypothetical protein [Candidatus Methanoperedens sp.]
MEKAIIISIIIGLVITLILIIETKEGRFSSIYIYPDSYTNYPEGSTTSFIYGVKSYELEKTSYDLEIFLNNKLIDSKHFELEPGEIHEGNETFEISGISYPAKVKLVLKSPYSTYETHYWLKDVKMLYNPVETPVTIPYLVPTPEPTIIPIPTPIAVYIPTVIPIMIDIRRGFSPQNVSIKIGDSIIWVNNDMIETKFTIVNQEGLFTKMLDYEKRFEYSFNKSGKYTFYLKENPKIRGTVDVE